MEWILHWLWNLTWQQAALFMLAGNAAAFFLALFGGNWAVDRWAAYKVAGPPPPLTRFETGLAAVNLVISAVVAFIGWLLWKAGWIIMRPASFGGALLDTALLLLVMDFAMYWGHRVAHHRLLFPWIHSWHHRYDNPRPLTLFVLHPLENFTFGGMWLLAISGAGVAGGFTSYGMLIYLTLNIGFGICGHLGVQPFRKSLTRLPLLRNFAGSHFHATHHADETRNFGFYTSIWDRLWGTAESRSAPRSAADVPS